MTQHFKITEAHVLPHFGRRATDQLLVYVAMTHPEIIIEGELTMAKANAEAKAAEMKSAEKSLRTRGVSRPRHIPQVEDADDNAGVDTLPAPMVNSGFSAFNQTPGATMTEAQAPKQTQEEREAAVKAKNAAKEAKLAAQAEAKEAKLAAQAEAKAAREKAKAEKLAELEAKKAEREKAAAERKKKLAAHAEELQAEGRKYVGSMLALSDRVKAGAYVKGMTGQLRTTDELAEALDAVPPSNVIKLGLEVLGLESNPYEALNVGQQSMNLRNKMRGALRQGKITLEQVKSIRDERGYATAEDEARAKAQAKADKEALKAKKLAEAEAAKQAKAAAKAEEPAEATA